MPEYEKRLHQIPFPSLGNKTHLMAAETDENGNWFAFPTIQPDDSGKLVEMELRNAQRKAMRNKNYKAFGKDKNSALDYAEGGYKKGTVIDDEQNRQRILAKLLRTGK
jgi:hypothetical protein